eukprot:2507741-Amphidinium_carterae.1
MSMESAASFVGSCGLYTEMGAPQTYALAWSAAANKRQGQGRSMLQHEGCGSMGNSRESEVEICWTR